MVSMPAPASTPASLIALGAALVGCGSHASEQPARVGCPDCTVLTEANVFDGTHAGQGTVVLQGERVTALHRGPVEIVDGDVVRLPGHTILPGLIDLHVHIRASAGPPAMATIEDAVHAHLKALLRSGVTTALDLGTERHVVFAYRQRIRDGVLLGPSLLAAGPGLTPTGGHPCTHGRPGFDLCAFVDDPIDAHGVVTDLARDRPDVVKAILESGTVAKPLPELSSPSLETLRATADLAGIPVVVHVAEAADVRKALDAGLRFFAHLPVRDRIDDALADRLAALGAVVIPTAAVEDARHRASLGQLDEVLGEDAAKDIPEDVLSAWRDPAMVASLREPDALEEAQRRRTNLLENLRTCHRAGVTIVAGTDAGNPATFHGVSLRREIELYVEAGLTPTEALRTATSGAAGALGLGDRGRIEAGMRADLLVVRGNPVEGIAALETVVTVYRLGERLDPVELAVDGALDLERTKVQGLADGAPCLGESECAQGVSCTWLAWCRRDCDETDCPVGQACFDWDARSERPYCDPGDGCDPIAQDCANGIACVWLGAGVTRCWYPGKAVAGEACSSWGACAPGFQCDRAKGTCVRLCDPLSGTPGCEQGEACVDRSVEAGVRVGECRQAS
jgi:imidazolonepropionase-like amidohydrolase